MDMVYVGKLVTTHGIKGEVRITSTFELKERVFKIGNELIINNTSYRINSYRVHKGYDMVTFEGINDINLVIPLKGAKVFIKRDLLELDKNDYLMEDLIGFNVVLNDEILGSVSDYMEGVNQLLEIDGDKKFYIPLKGDFIKNIDTTNKNIIVNERVRGLL